MGELKYKERDDSLAKCHFTVQHRIGHGEICQGIEIIRGHLNTTDYGLKRLVDDDTYVVFANADIFYYIGFFTKKAKDYYATHNKKWAIPKVQRGEYGNYFIPVDDGSVFKLFKGAFYYPRIHNKKYFPLVALLKQAFGDKISVKLYDGKHDGEITLTDVPKIVVKEVIPDDRVGIVIAHEYTRRSECPKKKRK